jgi:hypothetical protein
MILTCGSKVYNSQGTRTLDPVLRPNLRPQIEWLA